MRTSPIGDVSMDPNRSITRNETGSSSQEAPATEQGSAFMYILVVMLIFGLLGSAVISMYTSAERMTKGVSNEARLARSLAESGMRYAVSELRHDGYRRSVISRLNATTYTVADAGTFDLNLFGKWFRAAADYNIISGNISLNIPEGDVPQGFAIPKDALVVNLEELRDSIIFSGAANDDFISMVKNPPDMGTDPLIVELDNDFTVDQNQKVLLSIQADNSYSGGVTVPAGGISSSMMSPRATFPSETAPFTPRARWMTRPSITTRKWCWMDPT